jgi:hypothetical protein
MVVLGLLIFDAVASAQEIITLATRKGVSQSYFLTSIPKNLQAIGILFPGSGGLINLRSENGQVKFDQGNFLVRSRVEFVKRGVIAAIVDAPSDQQRNWGMSDEFRRGDVHFTDISAVVDDLGKRFPDVPSFLIGTSRGSVSVAALGAKFGHRVAGIVLTATMFRPASRKSKEPGPGLSGFDFASITIPALLVHHVSDQCEFTQYSDAARLSDQHPLVTVFGGATPQSGPCDPFSAHGFFGKESETVEQMVNWMLKKPFEYQVK